LLSSRSISSQRRVFRASLSKVAVVAGPLGAVTTVISFRIWPAPTYIWGTSLVLEMMLVCYLALATLARVIVEPGLVRIRVWSLKSFPARESTAAVRSTRGIVGSTTHLELTREGSEPLRAGLPLSALFWRREQTELVVAVRRALSQKRQAR
jgi:hypothetical protein